MRFVARALGLVAALSIILWSLWNAGAEKKKGDGAHALSSGAAVSAPVDKDARPNSVAQPSATAVLPPVGKVADTEAPSSAGSGIAERAAPTSANSKPDALEKSLAELQDQMKLYEGQFNLPQGIPESDEERIRLDNTIREAVSQGFLQGLSFQQVQARLGQYLRWQALPQVVAVGTQTGGNSVENEQLAPGLRSGWRTVPDPEARMPIVLYTEVGTPGGGTLHIFQNSLAYLESGVYLRQRWDAYSVLTSSAGNWTGPVTGEFKTSPPYLDCMGLFLVGTPINPEGVPGVALVEGPDGTGHFLRVYTQWFDAMQKAWSSGELQEFAGIGGWSYDGATSKLTVNCVFEEAGELQGTSPKIDLSIPLKEGQPKAQ